MSGVISEIYFTNALCRAYSWCVIQGIISKRIHRNALQIH